MSVSSLYSNSKKPVISMELFPPRNKEANEKFGETIEDLSKLNPDYLSMTFGAGGSNREGSYQAVKTMKIEKGLPTVAYIAGYGLGPEDIAEVLERYKDIGIDTVFVIRGDKPKEENYTPHPESFSYASEMIEFIKEQYNFTLGCAGYPEGHIDAESLEKDIEHLKLKVDNGAEYIVAQYFYDNKYFFEYVDKCRTAGIDVPIVPGIMPVYTVKLTGILARVCGATIADDMQRDLEKLSDADNVTVLNYGINFAAEQCRGLLKNGVQGLHFYTMNRKKSTTEIITRLREENLL